MADELSRSIASAVSQAVQRAFEEALSRLPRNDFNQLKLHLKFDLIELNFNFFRGMCARLHTVILCRLVLDKNQVG